MPTDDRADSEHDGYIPLEVEDREIELLRHEVEELQRAIEAALAEDEPR